ncbi:cystathionine beta-lyase [Bacillus sp. FJAT-27264]|uniref:trans-sulfuration enzyme family protein n=1 Tax=Paenibacillus sp. (strain DSM 101736 / FJAT-27264) TaxID=1850362 RepID=UPI000807EF9A|nr:PLP-dependent aspartate aminotransferase family protein [Bacillus sp. FJAT-27264]OBZ18826.1 cystathionine beta-lyase [Bacillus sp. FJAT-27264]
MSQYRFSTRAIHAGQEPDPTTGAVITPIYATSTFIQESPGKHKGYDYSRSGNPTRTALETCVAALEEGEVGFAFASGLAAETAIIDTLPRGSHIIVTDDLYGGTFRLLDKVKKDALELEVSYIDLSNPENIEEHIRNNTRLIWVETPTNPLLKIVDLRKIAAIAGKHKLISVCDNTFASPYLQQPLKLGFDLVVHSATKYLNGHSDVIAGIVVAKQNDDVAQRIGFLQNATGSPLPPFDAFLLLRGIKTLSVRMEAHCRNALAIAEFLERHPKVEKVIYPGLKASPYHETAKGQMSGFGGMVTFFVKGGAQETATVAQQTQLFTLAESLGGVESLIEVPAVMTHASIPQETREQIGIYDNLIRLSVGIEDTDDLIADLQAALESV